MLLHKTQLITAPQLHPQLTFATWKLGAAWSGFLGQTCSVSNKIIVCGAFAAANGHTADGMLRSSPPHDGLDSSRSNQALPPQTLQVGAPARSTSAGRRQAATPPPRVSIPAPITGVQSSPSPVPRRRPPPAPPGSAPDEGPSPARR